MPFVHQPEYIPEIPTATITTPTNNTRVENSVVVKGTARNIGGEYFLWLALYDYQANRYYPYNGPTAVSSNGEWEMTAFFGSSGRYDVTALAADQNANESLLLYRAACESSGEYPGLLALPPGCITLASVTVSSTQAVLDCEVNVLPVLHVGIIHVLSIYGDNVPTKRLQRRVSSYMLDLTDPTG